MPLSAAPNGQQVRILSLPSHPALERRLHSMGIKPGSELEVIRRGFPGAFSIWLAACSSSCFAKTRPTT
jgi:Fe2+ transport system protein FeoA